MKKLKRKFVKSLLKKRKDFSDKGDYGHALIFAGQKGYMGAALISTKACLRSGVGLVTVCVPAEERSFLQTSVPEAMVEFRDHTNNDMTKYSAVGMGPGLGVKKASKKMLYRVLSVCETALLLDADALNIIAANQKLWEKIPPNTIITPHEREFDRLFGPHTNTDERIKTAVERAKYHSIIIVLKGYVTSIITSKKVFQNFTGNSGLAKGGSGDALTGVVTSFLAQGYKPLHAAIVGVYLHGLASEITLNTQSAETMLITDVINNFGKTFKKISK